MDSYEEASLGPLQVFPMVARPTVIHTVHPVVRMTLLVISTRDCLGLTGRLPTSMVWLWGNGPPIEAVLHPSAVNSMLVLALLPPVAVLTELTVKKAAVRARARV